MMCICSSTTAFSHIATSNSHMIHDLFPKVVTFGVLHSEGLLNIFGVLVSV